MQKNFAFRKQHKETFSRWIMLQFEENQKRKICFIEITTLNQVEEDRLIFKLKMKILKLITMNKLFSMETVV